MSETVYTQLSRYTQPPLIIFGTLGAIFNHILFSSRKSLRTASCSFYFRALSINDVLVLYTYVLLQWLADQYGIDPTQRSIWFCKTKTYIITCLYTLSPYFVVLACFDRLCTSSTHVRLRRIATTRIAIYLIPAMIILVFAIYSHMPAEYTLIVGPTASVCASPSPQYNKILAVFVVVFLAFLPPTLMFTLCLATIILLRRQRRRIMPINQARLRQRDNQLFKMVLFYVAFHLICTIPFSTVLLIAVYQLPASSPTIAVLYRTFVLLFNSIFAISFYIYTLGTPFYRQEFFSLITELVRRSRRVVQPYGNQLRRDTNKQLPVRPS